MPNKHNVEFVTQTNYIGEDRITFTRPVSAFVEINGKKFDIISNPANDMMSYDFRLVKDAHISFDGQNVPVQYSVAYPVVSAAEGLQTFYNAEEANTYMSNNAGSFLSVSYVTEAWVEISGETNYISQSNL